MRKGREMLNCVILIGRLTKDPELKYTPNGTAVASFTLAVDRFRTNAQGEKETDFIPIVAWQKLAENCAEYLRKGSLAAVDGRMQVRSYDGKDGTKRWATEVIANAVRFLDSRRDRENQAGGGYDPRLGAVGGLPEAGFTEEDIPF